MGPQQTKHIHDDTLELLYQFAGSLRDQESMAQSREPFNFGVSAESGSNTANLLISQNSKKVDLRDLRINQVHKNLYLDLHIILPSIEFLSIMFVAMDANGNIEKIAVYNHKAFKRRSNQLFHIGARVQIINPYYKNAQDGYPLIRIDDPETISVKPTDQDQFFQGLLKLTNHLLPLDQGIAKSLLLHAESNPSLRGANLDQIKTLVSDYQPSQTQSQGPRQPEQPYWKGSHVRLPDFQNEAPQDLIDQNQEKELQDMMAEGGRIYPLYMRANSMVMINPKAAINSYQQLLKLTKRYAVIYFNCGEAAFQIGWDALAEAMMRDYLKLHEKKNFVFSKIYCFAHYHIGVSLQYQNKDLKEAEYYLQKAVSLDQKCLVFTQALSNFYYETNQLDKSAQFSQAVIDQFEKQTKKVSPNSQTYFSDIVELSRTYHIQMCAAKKSKNMEDLVLSAEKLSKLDELNFEFILGELNEVIMSQEYSFDEKRKLCELMSQSEEFDIIVEEFEVLLALQQKDFNLKLKCHSELSKKYQIEAKPPPVILDDEQKLFSPDEVAQTQLQLEQHIDQQLIDLILPERPDLHLQPNFEEAMSKRKNRSRKQTLEESRKKEDEKKQKYPGYITDVQYHRQQYVIIFSDEIKFENKAQKNKFRQAAQKGFASTKCKASGIKFINLKNGERMFEIKIIGQGERLICEKAEKIGKYRSEMKFTKLLSHKEAERFLKSRS